MRPWFGRWTGAAALPPLPNFFILGASRAGTSTLHAWLGQHPGIFMSRPKELWHFNRDDRYAKGLDHYRARFTGWQGETIIGECTPVYLYSNLLYRSRKQLYWSATDGPVHRIARDLPDARMLISLRHPLDRFISQYRKNSRRGKPGVGPDLETYARRCGAEGMAYRQDLENVLDRVGCEKVKIVVFEEWTQSPQVMLNDVCRFLDVPADFTFDVSDKVVRTGDESSLRIRLPGWVSGRKRDRKQTERLSAGLRAQLCEELVDDVAYVETLLGHEIDAWRTSGSDSSD